jgi:O-antigen ligase
MNASIFDKLIFVGLLLLLALTPLPYGAVEVWSTTLWELAVFALALLWAFDMVKTGRWRVARNPLALPLAGLLAIAVCQWRAPFSYDAHATLQSAVKIFASLLFFLLFASFVRGDARRALAVKIIIAVCAVIALVGIGQSYLGKLLWQRGIFGPFVNRNHFAGFLEMGIGLAGGILLARGTKREWLALYASALLAMSAGLVLSASRGGLLALVAELVFLVALAWPGLAENGKQANRLDMPGSDMLARAVGVLLLGALTIIGSIFLVGSEGLVENLAQIEKDTQNVTAGYDRFSRRDIWGASWQLIKDHPLTGVGLGAFPLAYTRYDPSSGAQRVEQAHNDYLQILADAGLLGGILALLFLVLLFARGFRALNTRDKRRRGIAIGALSGCFAIAVHSFIDFNLQVTANAQLFLALAALATSEKRRGDGETG